jgi:hypothetical protein
VEAAPTILRPAEGVGEIRLSMTREDVRSRWGEPEAALADNSIWEYPSRCAALVFSEGDRLHMASIGHATDAAQALSACPRAEVAGGLAVGDSIEEARSLFPDSRERVTRSGGTTLSIRSKATNLMFSREGRLHFAATSPPDGGDG